MGHSSYKTYIPTHVSVLSYSNMAAHAEWWRSNMADTHSSTNQSACSILWQHTSLADSATAAISRHGHWQYRRLSSEKCLSLEQYKFNCMIRLLTKPILEKKPKKWTQTPIEPKVKSAVLKYYVQSYQHNKHFEFAHSDILRDNSEPLENLNFILWKLEISSLSHIHRLRYGCVRVTILLFLGRPLKAHK